MRVAAILFALSICLAMNTDIDCITHRNCNKELSKILWSNGEEKSWLFYCMRKNRISKQLVDVEQFVDCLRFKARELVKCAEDNNCL